MSSDAAMGTLAGIHRDTTPLAPARHSHVALALGAAILATLPARGAQPAPQGPPGFHNLQVFPKDIKPDDLYSNMDGFIAALGVGGCDFCHAQAKLPPGVTLKPGEENFDFASDDKPAKKIARQMILMLRSLNTLVPTVVGKSPDKTVHLQCFNCHRGMQTPPLALADILDQTVKEKGMAAAIAQYKDLRRKYDGGVVYDFSDGDASDPSSAGLRLGGLDTYALQLIEAGRPDDAIPWLNLNFQYFPKSAGTWVLISMAQQKKKDKAAAISSAQKAVELAPAKSAYQWVLAQAKAMP